jgi:chitinase
MRNRRSFSRRCRPPVCLRRRSFLGVRPFSGYSDGVTKTLLLLLGIGACTHCHEQKPPEPIADGTMPGLTANPVRPASLENASPLQGALSASGATEAILAPSGQVPPQTTPTGAKPTTPLPGLSGRWLMGYYTGYEAHLLPPERIAFEHLTHVAISRVVPRPDGSLDLKMDMESVGTGTAMARKVAELAHARGKRAILMIGGEGTRLGFSGAMRKDATTFAGALIQTAKSLGMDGLDLDWEPMEKSDEAQVLQLARIIRAKAPELALSVPVEWSAKARPFYGELAKSVDRIHIMSYVMAGAWEGWKSWHSSALKGETKETPSSIDAAVRGYLAAGVPAAKLGIGAGFYGQCWNGVDGPGKTVGKATIVASDQKMSFRAIQSEYEPRAGKAGAELLWDEAARVPYMKFKEPTGPDRCMFLSYENVRSISEKAAYVKERGLGGAIVWTLAQGYIPNAKDPNPLLAALAALR